MFFLFLGTASRRPNEKHRSPLLVQADQSLRTLTAMVHAGMSDFYYFGMASRTDHHSPANCSLILRFLAVCYLTRKDMALSAISMNSALADKEFVLSLQNGQFQRNLSFFKAPDGVQFFQGVQLFPGVSNCLFPIETHLICDFPEEVRTPCSQATCEYMYQQTE